MNTETENRKKYISFKVYSEMYGYTHACIVNIYDLNLERPIVPCGDGTDYLISHYELDQIQDLIDGNIDEYDFKPASELKYPMNLLAMMRADGNTLKIPQGFRFKDKEFKDKEFKDIKNVMIKSGGTYKKNLYVFDEPAIDVYTRLLNGEEYNLKKKYQFFETTVKEAKMMVELAEIKYEDLVSEPSAGRGVIVREIAKYNLDVDVYELMPQNVPFLKEISEIRVHFLGHDFLEAKGLEGKYDKIVANPPFRNNQDIDHIRKMYDCLGIHSDCRLVSLASRHWVDSNGKKETEFRNWLSEKNARIIDLESGTFKESGTNVKTCIIVIDKSPRS